MKTTIQVSDKKEWTSDKEINKSINNFIKSKSARLEEFMERETATKCLMTALLHFCSFDSEFGYYFDEYLNEIAHQTQKK